jgi:hypothetical protein
MALKIGLSALNALFQIGGCILIGFQTNWVVGSAVFFVIMGHNIDKHLA